MDKITQAKMVVTTAKMASGKDMVRRVSGRINCTG
jgi:hypothetical protein